MALENSQSPIDNTMVKQNALKGAIESGRSKLSQLKGRISTNATRVGLASILTFTAPHVFSQTNDVVQTKAQIENGEGSASVEKKKPDPKIVAAIGDASHKRVEYDKINTQKYKNELDTYDNDMKVKVIIRGKITSTISNKFSEYFDIYLKNGFFSEDEQKFLLKLDKTIQKLVDEKLNRYEDELALEYQREVKILISSFQSSEIVIK